MSDDPVSTVTAAVTPAPIPESFPIPAVVALARDLAIGMYDEAVILRKHGITPEQYETLKTVPYFQNTVKKASEDWNAPRSAQERLAIQTAVGLEEVLPDVIARAKVKNEPLQGVAQLVKVLADICGANSAAGKQNIAPREQFKITINLGADTEVYNKTKPAITIDASPEAVELQPQPGGFGSLLTLSPEPEKA